MKFIVKLILIGVAAFFALRFFPWWVIVIIPFLFNLFVKTKGSGAFISSFLGTALAWFVASYNFYSMGAQAFTGKMAKVFFLPQNGLLLIIVASLLMGLVAAFAGFSGNAFRNIFVKPKDKQKSKYGRPDYSRYSR